MDDQFTSMLAYAAGAPGPLRLSVSSGNGPGEVVEVPAPYAIIGRAADSDIHLNDPNVSFRHTYLQVIGPRVACIDLLSSNGTHLSGPPTNDWLTSEHELKIGSSKIQLQGDDWLNDPSLPSPMAFRPRDESRMEFGVLPQVDLELLNTSHRGVRWPINRVITLLGRDESCRITISDDRLSRVQCSFLLLPSGLWVIDLMGKGGMLLNGQPCKCGFLGAGTTLEVGGYLLTAHYSVAQTATPPQAPQMPTWGEGEFVTRSNRIFQADFYHDTIVVYPRGDSIAFYFKDVHVEASRVCDLFGSKGFQNLVLDFSRVEQLPHTVLEGLTSICRSVPGKIVVCGVGPTTAQVVQQSATIRCIPEYANLSDAIQAIYAMA